MYIASNTSDGGVHGKLLYYKMNDCASLSI